MRPIRLTAALLSVLALAVTSASAAPPSSAKVLHVPNHATLTIKGHGFGHGHGLSQYGAQGAALKGKSTNAILAFYYPGTTRGTFAGTAKVLITENIGGPTTVVARPGLRVRDLASDRTVAVPTTGKAKHATRWRMTGTGGGRTKVSYLASGWHTWRTLSGNGEFRSTKAALTLVLPHAQVTYRGTLRSMAPISSTTHRITVNVVPLETYVRGVVPKEMPPSWKPAALRSQAIAARTYAAYEIVDQRGSTDQRFNLGDSTSWQVYGGVSGEVASTNAATVATAHQVRLFKKQPAFTQFSASNGGWTSAGGKPYLPAKQDPYDGWSGNNVHTWSTKVGAAKIERIWGLGNLTGIRIDSRDCHGQWNGRVEQMTLIGSKRTVSLTGDAFRSGLGLLSQWFHLAV